MIYACERVPLPRVGTWTALARHLSSAAAGAAAGGPGGRRAAAAAAYYSYSPAPAAPPTVGALLRRRVLLQYMGEVGFPPAYLSHVSPSHKTPAPPPLPPPQDGVGPGVERELVDGLSKSLVLPARPEGQGQPGQHGQQGQGQGPGPGRVDIAGGEEVPLFRRTDGGTASQQVLNTPPQRHSQRHPAPLPNNPPMRPLLSLSSTRQPSRLSSNLHAPPRLTSCPPHEPPSPIPSTSH